MLHQLRRVEKGLRGEVLRPEDDMEGFDTTSYPISSVQRNDEELPQGNDTALDARIASLRKGAQAAAGEEEAEHTPMLGDVPIENYQEQMRHQGRGIFEGEIDSRTNVIGALRVNTPSQGKKRRHEEMNGDTPLQDKEARKQAKKARNKERQLQKQNAGKDTAEPGEPMELDETRELHDEVGPSSNFLSDKIFETVAGPSAANIDEAEQPDAKERWDERKKRRKQKHRKSDVDIETPAKALEPEPRSETKPTNGTVVSGPPSEKKSTKNNRNRDRKRHPERTFPPGPILATNRVHKYQASAPDSPVPRTNGTTSIPEIPETIRKRKSERSPTIPNGTIDPSNATIIQDIQVTVPESPATNHKLSSRIKPYDKDEEKHDERSERKRIRKAEKAEKRRKKELKHVKGTERP